MRLIVNAIERKERSNLRNEDGTVTNERLIQIQYANEPTVMKGNR